MTSYTALHCHSTYSFLDGVGSVQHWVVGAKNKGLNGLALTDHGDNSNIHELYYWGKKEKFPVIFGCEFYITDSITNNQSDNRYRHVIVWVKDATGYINLCKLHKLAFSPDHFYYRPRITYDELASHKNGLIVGSACIAGVIAADIVDYEETFLKTGVYDENLRLAWERRLNWFLYHFGEDFYLEMQYQNQCHDWNHKAHTFELLPKGLDRQKLVNAHYLDIARKFNIKLVASPDAHMVDASEKRVQDCMMGTRYMSKSSDNEGDREVLGWHFHETYYLPDYNEMLHYYDHNFNGIIKPEIAKIILANSNEILDKCKNITFDKKVYLPNVDIPGATTGKQKILFEIKRLGILNKFLSDPAYKKRLSYELETLCNNGVIDLSGYFLLLADVVDWCKSNDVVVGPGRGSAGGCLVAFALGITKINPIQWGLSFERFLNPARVKMGTLPDIDIDFSDPQRVFEYLCEKWGENYVAGISANQTFKYKMALKDAYRGLTTNSVGSELENICKMIGEDESDEVIDAFEKSQQVLKWISDGERGAEKTPVTPELRREILAIARRLKGQMRHRGVHAAAVVVSPVPIHELVPVARVAKAKDKAEGKFGKWVTQYTMKWVEEAGLVKFDILGLNTLNDIGLCIKLIRKYRGLEVDPYDLDWTDPEVYANFTADNVTSIFQFDTDVAKPFLQRMRPSSIADLAQITALARPGAMDSKQDLHFMARWTNQEEVKYPHPALEPVLKDTLGIMIFQEQVMAAVQILGGFSAEEADEIRRGMGKKRADLIDAAKQRFIDYAVATFPDIDGKRANQLWDLIESFARYGFNKSHAYAYAMIAYISQYLKTKFPKEWWCAVLQNEDDESRFKRIFAYINNLDSVRLIAPDINDSHGTYTINGDGDIVTPLNYIKKVGDVVLDKIIGNRGSGYTSLLDFASRKYEVTTVTAAGIKKNLSKSIADKNVILQLIWAGCFNKIHPELTKKQLVEMYYNWRITANKETKKVRETLQKEFDDSFANMNRVDEIIRTAMATPVLSMDYHKVISEIMEAKLTPFHKIVQAPNFSYVYTGGLVSDVSYIRTKKKQDAAFLEVQNAGEIIKVILWPEKLKKFYDQIRTPSLVVIEGKVNVWNNNRSVVVDNIKIVESKIEAK